MIKVTMILDNKYASSLKPIDFVKEIYLTQEANEDLEMIIVEQESDFPELDNINSGRH